MTATRFAVKHLVLSAAEVEVARQWLRENTKCKCTTRILGIETVATASDNSARIGVRYYFECEEDGRRFLAAFPDSREYRRRPGLEVTERLARLDSGSVFGEGARRILCGPQPISAGKIHFLGLEKVKKHFGQDWLRLAPRVETIVQRSIERRLTPRDVYQKSDGLNYVILFAELTDRDAEIKCRLMAEDISQLLVGEQIDREMLKVSSLAIGVKGLQALDKILDPGEIVSKIEGAVEAECKQRIATTRASLDVDETDPLKDVHFVYRPIWNVRRSVVASFNCIPVRRPAGRPAHAADLPLQDLPTGKLRYELDCMAIDRAIDDFTIMRERNQRLTICVPLHFESVSTASRRRNLQENWLRIPAEYKRATIFEITNMPEAVPPSRVVEMVSALRATSGSVIVRLALTSTSVQNFANTGVIAVGADISRMTGGEERVIKLMQDFVVAAESARLLTYLSGLHSFSLTLMAIASGFTFVDGDPISSMTESPNIAFRMRVEDLYSNKVHKVQKRG